MTLASGMGNAVGALFLACVIMFILFMPMGIWKWIEVIIWLWRHIHFSWGAV